MDPRDVPLPSRMQRLPRDHRGYPVPVLVYVDKGGRPHFTINDDGVRARVIERDLCSICGTKLLRGRWFVGGPGSAFSEHGAYIDPPMHGECARYALQVCPYLAAPNYAKRINAATVDARAARADVFTVDPTMDPDRPEVFVAAMSIGNRTAGTTKALQEYVWPNRPWRRVEWWRNGLKLDIEAVLALPEWMAPRDQYPFR